jgi:integrase
MHSKRPDYLFKRRGSQNWYVRLQPRGQTPIEKSLGTPDHAQAVILAMPLIASHKQHLLDTRPRIVAEWMHDYPPGLHALPDGGHITATDSTLTVTDAAGKLIGTRPNGRMGFGLAGRDLPMAEEFQALDDAWSGKIGEGPLDQAKSPIVLKNSSGDDSVMSTYIKHAGLDADSERRAWAMWQIFRSVVDKPLKDCTRDDGRAIVAHLDAEANGEAKSATLRRRMVPLIAAVNLAIDEGKHGGINPFMSCVPNRKDEAERDAIDDNDMKIIRKNLHKLDAHDQLLLRVLATMGVRRGEAFEIASEQKEDGIRFCTIGTKTPQSLRRLPFPKDLLPYLPKKINGPLFSGRQDSAGKRLDKFLRDIGIINETDGRNVAPMHSFRHRAKNRLRRAVPDDELRCAIGGWTDGKKSSGRKYGNKHGKGYPIKVLKAAIDTIGF